MRLQFDSSGTKSYLNSNQVFQNNLSSYKNSNMVRSQDFSDLQFSKLQEKNKLIQNEIDNSSKRPKSSLAKNSEQAINLTSINSPKNNIKFSYEKWLKQQQDSSKKNGITSSTSKTNLIETRLSLNSDQKINSQQKNTSVKSENIQQKLQQFVQNKIENQKKPAIYKETKSVNHSAQKFYEKNTDKKQNTPVQEKNDINQFYIDETDKMNQMNNLLLLQQQQYQKNQEENQKQNGTMSQYFSQSIQQSKFNSQSQLLLKPNSVHQSSQKSLLTNTNNSTSKSKLSILKSTFTDFQQKQKQTKTNNFGNHTFANFYQKKSLNDKKTKILEENKIKLDQKKSSSVDNKQQSQIEKTSSNLQKIYMNIKKNQDKIERSVELRKSESSQQISQPINSNSSTTPVSRPISQQSQVKPSLNSFITKVPQMGQSVKIEQSQLIKKELNSKKIEKQQEHVYFVTNLQKYSQVNNQSDYFNQIYLEHFQQSFQALTFCKMLRPVDPQVLSKKSIQLKKRESHKNKKTLIFDLDETLIHCNDSLALPSDVILPIKFPHGEIIEAGINVRPFALEILKEMSQLYEVIVFTASHSCYANRVLDYLDPRQQYIHHRLYRENCVQTDEGIYIKDLRIFADRKLEDIIIVDNACYSFGYHVDNGIPIIPFYDNKDDQELKDLIPYLKSLLNQDIQQTNKQTFQLYKYTLAQNPEDLLNELF